ncbi:unnamed protein product [Heligmosomoides polygyrus]|uniref:Uncharacterized protein n=1 Tax=Heligmosomoides polygyrus TaxID=6339 RepID=A0A183FWS5_HELPZ|nr:unnamed protein product [Heligmosomoides polygyrus]
MRPCGGEGEVLGEMDRVDRRVVVGVIAGRSADPAAGRLTPVTTSPHDILRGGATQKAQRTHVQGEPSMASVLAAPCECSADRAPQ